MEFDIDTVERLTRLAFEFGPFLFAVVGLFLVTRIAYGYLEKAQKRADDLKRTTSIIHKSIYASSWVFSFILVGVSVYWWIGNRPEQNVYRFTVIDLGTEEFITASDEHTFSRSISIGNTQSRNVDFAVLSREPLKDISPFRVKYFNDLTATVTPFEVPYDPEKRAPKFKIEDGIMTVVDSGGGQPTRFFRLITTAVADHFPDPQTSTRENSTANSPTLPQYKEKQYRYVSPTIHKSENSVDNPLCCLPSSKGEIADVVKDNTTETYVPSKIELYQIRQQLESIKKQ